MTSLSTETKGRYQRLYTQKCHYLVGSILYDRERGPSGKPWLLLMLHDSAVWFHELEAAKYRALSAYIEKRKEYGA